MRDSDREAEITQYIRDHLSPKEDERNLVAQRYHQLQGFLGDRTIQHGSYARHTSTTPVNDLDVMYVLPEEIRKTAMVRATVDPTRLDLDDVVESLAAELGRCYGSSARVVAEPPSVGIYFGSEDEFSMDVVPVVEADAGMYWVPDVAHLSIGKRRAAYRSAGARPGTNWIKSDPKGYINQARDLDEASEGRFRKAAKAMKKWRWRCKDSHGEFPLQSFHLELAVTGIVGEEVTISCSGAITRVVRGLNNLLIPRQCPDRADATRFVDEYIASLSTNDRRLLEAEFQAARDHWNRVLTAASPAEVRMGLGVFFGSQQTDLPAVRSAANAPVLARGMSPEHGREAGEQFLSDLNIPIDLQYRVRIDARVSQRGFRDFSLRQKGYPLRKGADLEFHIASCTVPEPFSVKWKVKNTGAEAARVGQLRGEINEDAGRFVRPEKTRYWGNHYVQCYVIKNGVCIAADHIEVPIGSA